MPAADGQSAWDTAIVGAGPAGASCALWLKLLGFQPIVIDARPQPGGRLADSPYDNPWVAVAQPGATGLSLAGDISSSLAARSVDVMLGERVTQVARTTYGFVATSSSGASVTARTLVLATGLEAATGGLPPATGVFFGPGQAVFDLDVRGRSVAVLGGGDNAFDHAALLRSRGAARVAVFARSIRARAALVEAVDAGCVTVGHYEVDTRTRRVAGGVYDYILVMYGFAPCPPRFEGFTPRTTPDGCLATDWACAQTSEPGLYAIGDLAARAHPSVPTALADGVTAAKAIEAVLLRKP
jgi:thioredoxin reductase